tara:strand:+ start:1274 stop:1525 length:252 start_codon:yes stop_codon:yes gene_type:complete
MQYSSDEETLKKLHKQSLKKKEEEYKKMNNEFKFLNQIDDNILTKEDIKLLISILTNIAINKGFTIDEYTLVGNLYEKLKSLC